MVRVRWEGCMPLVSEKWRKAGAWRVSHIGKTLGKVGKVSLPTCYKEKTIPVVPTEYHPNSGILLT